MVVSLTASIFLSFLPWLLLEQQCSYTPLLLSPPCGCRCRCCCRHLRHCSSAATTIPSVPAPLPLSPSSYHRHHLIFSALCSRYHCCNHHPRSAIVENQGILAKADKQIIEEERDKQTRTYVSAVKAKATTPTAV